MNKKLIKNYTYKVVDYACPKTGQLYADPDTNQILFATKDMFSFYDIVKLVETTVEVDDIEVSNNRYHVFSYADTIVSLGDVSDIDMVNDIMKDNGHTDYIVIKGKRLNIVTKVEEE